MDIKKKPNPLPGDFSQRAKTIVDILTGTKLEVEKPKKKPVAKKKK
jgi:hypothetical protein